MSVHALVVDLPSLLVLLDDLRVLYSLHLSAERMARNRKSVATVLLEESDSSDTEGALSLLVILLTPLALLSSSNGRKWPRVALGEYWSDAVQPLLQHGTPT